MRACRKRAARSSSHLLVAQIRPKHTVRALFAGVRHHVRQLPRDVVLGLLDLLAALRYVRSLAPDSPIEIANTAALRVTTTAAADKREVWCQAQPPTSHISSRCTNAQHTDTKHTPSHITLQHALTCASSFLTTGAMPAGQASASAALPALSRGVCGTCHPRINGRAWRSSSLRGRGMMGERGAHARLGQWWRRPFHVLPLLGAVAVICGWCAS